MSNRKNNQKPAKPPEPKGQAHTTPQDDRWYDYGEGEPCENEVLSGPYSTVEECPPVEPQAQAIDQSAVHAALFPDDGKPNIKPHLRCPCCWNGLGGKAKKRKWQRQVSGPLVQRCYVCDQCGAEWVVDVRAEESDGVEWVETKISQVRKPPGDAA